MDRATRLFHITATGDVGPAGGGELISAVLSPAAAVSTLTLKEGGSSGASILIVQAAANGAAVQVQLAAAGYTGQLHATLAGTGATATIEL